REVDELWRILLSACGSVKAGNTICVLDALDECRDNDRKWLITMLTKFYTSRTPDKSSSGWLKFLVTSRPYEVIQDHFSENFRSLPLIRLRGEEENDQIRHEIDLVIEEKVEKLANDLKLPAGTKDKLKHQLLAMEHRTYLWLYLAIEEIRETYRESFRPHSELIQSLPTTVGDAYEKILERGAIRNKDNVRRILQIVVGARRPLKVAEMAVALSVATSPPSELKLDIDESYVAAHLPHWCGLFIFINHSRIYLIHQTAKEFLVRDAAVAVANNQAWKHCLSMTDVELSMTTVCVRYLAEKGLSLESSKTQSHDQRKLALFFGKSSDADTFWAYSAEHWAGHVRSIQDEVSLFPMDRIMKLYNTSEERFQHWFPILYKAIEPWETEDISKVTSNINNILLAALNGHSTVLQRLLETDKFDLNATDHQRRTALVTGSEHGYTKVVQLLLDKGADVNAQGGYYGNALQAASSGGYSEIVQLLLDKGADINAQDGYYGTALYAASSGGYSEIVQLLLDKGADVNAQGGYYGNALQAASSGGYSEIVQLLLDKGADVNAQDGYYGNALHAASSGGYSEIVQLLLDKGADVNAQGGYYGNVLQVASIRGYSEIVQLLLDNGAKDTLQAAQ
ncbi:MAG: hypothetical protein Q9214_000665, partial [Letrouitia sp. 1 TL-2023]